MKKKTIKKHGLTFELEIPSNSPLNDGDIDQVMKEASEEFMKQLKKTKKQNKDISLIDALKKVKG